MTKQLEVWKSEFGKDWTDRTNIDPMTRVDAFRRMVGDLEIKTILEVGCGKGHNLIALSQIGDYKMLWGIDPLDYAIWEARWSVFYKPPFHFIIGNCFNIGCPDSLFDLVFSCGVLMHVSGEDLPSAVSEMSRVSRRYILIIEYYAQDEISIPYRGYEDLLFKRNYREEGEKMGLRSIDAGVLSKEEGFDECNWWLFEK